MLKSVRALARLRQGPLITPLPGGGYIEESGLMGTSYIIPADPPRAKKVGQDGKERSHLLIDHRADAPGWQRLNRFLRRLRGG